MENTITETESNSRNEHEATAPNQEKRTETDPVPKDMNIETLSKVIKVLQQTTEGRMKLVILFQYRAQPTTKTTSKKKSQGQ